MYGTSQNKPHSFKMAPRDLVKTLCARQIKTDQKEADDPESLARQNKP